MSSHFKMLWIVRKMCHAVLTSSSCLASAKLHSWLVHCYVVSMIQSLYFIIMHCYCRMCMSNLKLVFYASLIRVLVMSLCLKMTSVVGSYGWKCSDLDATWRVEWGWLLIIITTPQFKTPEKEMTKTWSSRMYSKACTNGYRFEAR